MRSVFSVRLVVAVAATVAAVIATTVLLAPPPRASVRPQSVVTLAEAVDRTTQAGSARLRGTATSAEGAAVDLEGVTSFTSADAVLFARDGGDGTAIEVRTTSAGSWVRAPSLGGWIPLESTSAMGPGAANGWADVLARLRRAPAPRRSGRRFEVLVEGEPAVVHVDGHGRIRRLHLERRQQVVDVTFSDFGVAVAVEPPEDVLGQP